MSESSISLGNLFSDTKASVQFLSRLPIEWQNEDENAVPAFQNTAHTFPLAGLIIALPAALLLWLGSALGFAPTVSAFLCVGVLIATTGALHEDGLADVADGFWGGHTRDRKLEIMRDSAIGTYGVLSLVWAVGLRIALVTSLLFSLGGFWAAVYICLIAALSRTTILYVWHALPAARTASSPENAELDGNGKESSGLSARYGGPAYNTLQYAVILCLPIGALMVLTVGLWATAASLVAGAAAAYATSLLAKKHVGGHTGDILGATQQISEIGLLLGLVWLI